MQKAVVPAAEAIARVAASLAGSVAILHTPAADGLFLTVLTMTAFGPSVRKWENATPGFFEEVCRDSAATLETVKGSEVLVCAVSDRLEHENLLGRFMGLRPRIPERGSARSTWWSRAEIADQVSRGDQLEVFAETTGARTAIRYRTLDGRGAGVHALISRPPSNAEIAVLARARAFVTSVTFGSVPDIDGDIAPSVLLMLDIPAELARSFPDGILPMSRRSA